VESRQGARGAKREDRKTGRKGRSSPDPSRLPLFLSLLLDDSTYSFRYRSVSKLGPSDWTVPIAFLVK